MYCLGTRLNHLVTLIFGKNLISSMSLKKWQTIGWKLPTNFFFYVFGKIFEEFIFNRIYNPNQSGFRSSDSCINQLLAITHEIFEVFDYNPPLEVRLVFQIYQTLLTRFGINACFISLSQWVSQDIFLIFLKIIYKVDFKELF